MREHFGRVLFIQGSRPELVLKFEDAIGLWEMSAVLWLLCALDGSLYIPTVKAIWCTSLKLQSQNHVYLTYLLIIIADGAFRDRALVIDSMHVIQIMKKTATMHTLADLKEA